MCYYVRRPACELPQDDIWVLPPAYYCAVLSRTHSIAGQVIVHVAHTPMCPCNGLYSWDFMLIPCNELDVYVGSNLLHYCSNLQELAMEGSRHTVIARIQSSVIRFHQAGFCTVPSYKGSANHPGGLVDDQGTTIVRLHSTNAGGVVCMC